MPRILVFALSDELWAAYDVEYSRLYKTWKGGISFNGPMYDDRHNVQSSTRGITYSADTSRRSPWFIKVNGRQETVKPEYLGYTLHGTNATVHYRIKRPRSTDILIDETPACDQTDDHAPLFKRTFSTKGMSPDDVLTLHIRESQLQPQNGIDVDAAAFHSQTKSINQNLTVDGDVQLKNNGTTTLLLRYVHVDHPVRTANQQAADSANIAAAENHDPSSASTGEDGARLISMNDCAACHSVDKKLIGPSFNMIAGRYEVSDDVIEKLSDKIIRGGTGAWGRQVMTAHPNISKEQATSMVRYILSLDSSSGVSLKPGLAANFYKPGIQLSQIPDFIPGQKPNLSTTVPDIEFVGVDMSINREKNDFFGFDDQFVMYLSGYLKVDTPGTYEMKLKANAGARFILNGKKIADVNYSNYDYQEQEFTAQLKKGLNRIRVEYYEDIYSSNLSLRWQRHGEHKYRKIPEELFFYEQADIQPTAPGIKEVYEVNAPGFGSDVDGIHPSFTVSTVRPEGFNKRLSDLGFLPDGSLAVATWDSSGSIYILEGALGNDRSKIKARLFAKGLYEVMGLEYVDGKLYALQKWELTELNDTDGDGVADDYRVALDDWSASANFHEWAFGLIYKDGYFYFNTGISLGGNGIVTDTGIRYTPRIQTKDRGKTLKVKKSDWTFEPLSHGYKAPNGIGFGVDGEIFTTDNEGHMVPTNKLMHVPQNGYPFFGNDEVLQQLHLPVPKMKPPVLWMPESELSNSPSQPVVFKMGPYQEGQMVFGDVHHGGLHRVFVEKVNGEYQGAIFRFTQGLEAGINRLAWGPDKNLYMAGLGAGGDFGHYGQCCGLQRFSFNGKTTMDILSVKAKQNGLEIEFTQPLRAGDGIYTTDYAIQQFWYETADDVPEGGVKNDIENLQVRSVNVFPDRKKVFLEIDGFKKEHVVYVKIVRPFISKEGNGLWAGDAWYTMNNISQEKGSVGKKIIHVDNILQDEEKLEGWKQVFHGYKITTESDPLVMSDMDYKDFELEFDFDIGAGGDAGIYYHLPAGVKGKLTGLYPGMQMTDESGSNVERTHLTGALVDMIGPKYKISKPNQYNHMRLLVRDGHAEHWLNGIRVAQYDLNSSTLLNDWNKKFGKPITRTETGRIGFAVQKGSVKYKNIRIRKL
jgi:cytochrome c